MSSVSGPCIIELNVCKFYGVDLLIHYSTDIYSILTMYQALG